MTQRMGHTPGFRQRSLADESGLSDIRRAIRADLRRAGVDPAACFDCLVAVTEACTNAIVHGKDVDDPAPELRWSVENGQVRFVIQDFSSAQWHARATHPSRDPDAGAELQRRIGGFGLELMRGLMDSVDVRIGPRGMTVELVKQLGDTQLGLTP